MRELKSREIAVDDFPVASEALAELIGLVAAKTVSISVAQEKVFPAMIDTGESAKEIIEKQGLAQVSDTGALDAAVDALTSLMEPLMLVFLGGMVGYFLIAMYMPIFELAGAVG